MSAAAAPQCPWFALRPPSSGEMDFVLLKPVSARFLLSCSGVNPGAAANAAIGLGVVLYAVHAAPPSGPWGISVAYVALMACAVVTFYNILFMLLTVSFWATKVDGLQYLFEEVLNLAGLPISVYKGALGVVFSYLIPLGVAATVPAGLLAGHPDPIFYVYAPTCVILTGILSQWVWRRAVGSYTSAGG